MKLYRDDILKDKVVFITGSTSGLGNHLAMMCKDYGAKVIGSGRNPEKCNKCSQELGIPYVQLDVLHPETFHQKIQEVVGVYGDLDVLVNNAGVSLHRFSILNTSISDWDKTIDTNCKGGYFLTKEFIDFHINERKNDKIRKIIFTASNAGIYGYDDLYPLSKCMMIYFVKCIADKYFHSGIRINCVSPSGIEDNCMNGNGSHLTPNSCPSNLSKRSLSKEEISNIYIYLMSNESNSVNGANFVINEGKKV